MINYQELKAAMADAGYAVSDGDQWTVRDSVQYRQFCYHNYNGLVPHRDLMALAYPGIAPVGFPGTVEPKAPLLTILTSAVIQPTDQRPIVVYRIDGRTRTNVTDDCTFESSDPAVLEVDGPSITCLSYGVATLTVHHGDLVASTTVISTDEPVPALIEPNTAPDARTLNSNGTVLTGTGIPSQYAASATDGLLQTFVIPMVSGKRVIGPSDDDGIYRERLAWGEDASICIGVSDLAGVGFESYTIAVAVQVDNSSCSFLLEEREGQHVWTTTKDPDYVVDDNFDNGVTVQNAMRLRHLKEAGLILKDVGTVTLTVHAEHIATGSVFENSVTIHLTKE